MKNRAEVEPTEAAAASQAATELGGGGRDMASGQLAEPLLHDAAALEDAQADAIKRTLAVERRGSLTSAAEQHGHKRPEQLEVEDALDRVGGVGCFQLVQFWFAGMFWFLSPSILFSVFANGPCIGARLGCEFDAANTGAPTDCCTELRGALGAETCGDGVGICYEATVGVECATVACAALDQTACIADPSGAWSARCWAEVDGANSEVACAALGTAAASYAAAELECTAGGGVLGVLEFLSCSGACPDPDEDPPNPLCPPPGLPGSESQAVCPLASPNRAWWSRCTNLACQFDLTGDRAYLRPLLDSSFFLGWLWGAPVGGRISDKYGRRVALYLFFGLNAIGALSSAVAPSVYVYMFARHLTGAGLGGSSLTAYLIGTEYSPRSQATAIKAAWSLFSVCGYIWQSFFAKFLFYSLPGYNWRLMHLILFAPYLFSTIVSFFVLAESPRWLLVNRGTAAAARALAVVARRNGQEAQLATFELRSPVAADGAMNGDGLWHLFCVPTLRTRLLATLVLWFAAAFSYYGLTLRAEALPGNVYDVFAIMSSVEAPAVMLLIPTLNSPLIGRRGGTLGLFLLLGIGSFLNMLWRTPTAGLVLNIAGRAFSGAAFSAVYVWSTENFPSSLRQVFGVWVWGGCGAVCCSAPQADPFLLLQQLTRPSLVVL